MSLWTLRPSILDALLGFSPSLFPAIDWCWGVASVRFLLGVHQQMPQGWPFELVGCRHQVLLLVTSNALKQIANPSNRTWCYLFLCNFSYVYAYEDVWESFYTCVQAPLEARGGS